MVTFSARVGSVAGASSEPDGPDPGSGPGVTDVVIVEDDEGDALLVSELLLDALPDVAVRHRRSLTAAIDDLPSRSNASTCVVLDLGLPDAIGTDGVTRLIAAAPGLPIVVLTGANDEVMGIAAVAAGAQDYLVKGTADAVTLGRAIRYAVERCRADDASRRLYEAERRRDENTRLERGLLPQPLLHRRAGEITVRYRPGSAGAQLGGDFYDAVEMEDGTLHVVIGDVAGHGPDEAALGVCLRVAWRSLTLAGLGQSESMVVLDRVLRSERTSDTIFATVSSLRIPSSNDRVELCSAGHPLPLVLGPRPRELSVPSHGPLLGVFDGAVWPVETVEHDLASPILLFTDGLVEGYAEPGGPERLGIEAVLEILTRSGLGPDATSALDDLLIEVERRNGAPLVDDVALCLVRSRP